MESVKLNNGGSLPAVGFGTAQSRGEQCIHAVQEAIRSGYGLIDTASQYKNEEAVGLAVKEFAAKRDEIIVSSKLWNDSHGYDEAYQAYNNSLKWMKIEKLDMYLIHWPNPKDLRGLGYENHNADTWRAMEELYDSGRLKIIGVSNFKIHHLDALIKRAKIMPMVNQICVFPGYIDWDLIKYCKDREIVVQAYSPLAAGKILKDPLLLMLADKYQKNTAQICLRWHLQNGIVPIPKSVTNKRIRSNLNIFDFELSRTDMELINSMKSDIRILPDPDKADF